MGASRVLIVVKKAGTSTYFPTWTRDDIEGAEFAYAGRVLSGAGRLGLDACAAAFLDRPRAAEASGLLWSAVEWFLDDIVAGGDGEGAHAEALSAPPSQQFMAACVIDIDGRSVDFLRPGDLPGDETDALPGLRRVLRVQEDVLAVAGEKLLALIERTSSGEVKVPPANTLWEERFVRGDESMLEPGEGDDGLAGAHVTMGLDGSMRVARPFSAMIPDTSVPGHLDLYVVLRRQDGLLHKFTRLFSKKDDVELQWATAVPSGQPVMLYAETGPFEVWRQTVPEGLLDPSLVALGALTPHDVFAAMSLEQAKLLDKGTLAAA